MRWIPLVPLLCGLAVVTQGGLNRRFAGQWGLWSAALLNMTVALVATFSVYALLRWAPGVLPGGGSVLTRFGSLTPWHVLPGLCGVVIVAGMPLAISRLGAVQSVLLLIAAQLVAGLVWDALVENRPATAARIVGSVVAFAGAAIAVWKG
ncbi:hypothetical protein DRW03_06765 [Corallococcus sp. H22C18031201]|uniref:DMT family transporter n=1 Tax=Citreicoccus inhibens TaxID=2849499 RepID=UPI000E718D24|nr:DMT family transporter [Citreicoccus inhibens]MBU8895252.1 DMT family transporter [Citreicoccus inhibens]RJS26152.1 hypothetical protein DRW03_06765 [Corallococcus sp. H22C18031201]